MGIDCSSKNDKTNNTNNPVLLCYFTYGNEKQKNYCTKLVNRIYDKNIRYYIQPNNYFSINFLLKGINHIVKNDSDLSDNSINIIINRIHNISTQTYNNAFYPQHPNYNAYNNNQLIYNNNLGKLNKGALEKMEKNILVDQLNKRKMEYSPMTEKDLKINKELENMCNLGKIMKYKIREEKMKNPHKYIEVKEALKLENQDQGLFALGLLGNILEQNQTEVIIEKYDNGKDELDAGTTVLQFISSGLANKKKYDLHFDFGDKRNNELLNNANEYEKFKRQLILKLSKDYNVPISKIVVTFPQKGSFRVQVIFQSEQFNNLNLSDFKQKFKKDKNFPELQKLKEIHTSVIMEGCKLSKNQLDYQGNRSSGWPIGENRGKKPYYAPLGWIGIGLKVLDKYDKGNNKWIGMNNSDGEWCVAYHGVARNLSSQEVQGITGKIVKSTFKPGVNQAHSQHEDQYHPGKKVGDGVYCTPLVNVASSYAGITVINGVKYQTVLMVRVKPEAIRGCKDQNDYWVVNGTTDEIRPYRILYKQC